MGSRDQACHPRWPPGEPADVKTRDGRGVVRISSVVTACATAWLPSLELSGKQLCFSRVIVKTPPQGRGRSCLGRRPVRGTVRAELAHVRPWESWAGCSACRETRPVFTGSKATLPCRREACWTVDPPRLPIWKK